MLCAYQKDHCGSNVEDAGIRWLPGSRGKNDEGLDREGGIWEKQRTPDRRHVGSRSTATWLDFKVLARRMEKPQE